MKAIDYSENFSERFNRIAKEIGMKPGGRAWHNEPDNPDVVVYLPNEGRAISPIIAFKGENISCNASPTTDSKVLKRRLRSLRQRAKMRARLQEIRRQRKLEAGL